MKRIRVVAVTITALIFGPVAIYLGFAVWESTHPRQEPDITLASFHIRGRLGDKDRQRFVHALNDFALSRGFERFGQTKDLPEARPRGFVDLSYVRRDAVQFFVEVFPDGGFTLAAIDFARTGNAGQLREPLIELVENEFKIKPDVR
jgi:hypothetical protein